MNPKQGLQDAPPDEDDLELATFMQQTAERLLRQLPNFISIPQADDHSPPESFTLSHPDFSAQNILVNSSGALVGIIDCECTNALPTWFACQIPHVLDSLNSRTEKPFPEHYTDGAESELYLEHLEAYEQTLLWQFFLARMKEIEPSWIAEFESQEGNRKRDFETAVKWAGDISGLRRRDLEK